MSLISRNKEIHRQMRKIGPTREKKIPVSATEVLECGGKGQKEKPSMTASPPKCLPITALERGRSDRDEEG